MFRNRIYYRVKPFIPRGLRTIVRRRLALRLQERRRDVWPILPGSEQPPPGWMGWPGNKKFAFVLTHDIEGEEGLRKCRRLMEVELELGFRSSFNFIPEGGYQVAKSFRDELTTHGFEVGVHDLKHNGLLFLTRREFTKKAPRINHYLQEWGAVGFRAGFMLHNLDWLHGLEIDYDASTFDTDPFEPQPEGRHTIFPVWIPNSQDLSPNAANRGYIELPYTLPQDSTLFLILREQTSAIWLRKLDWIAEHGGMALLNVHPDYVRFPGEKPSRRTYPISLYRDLLLYVRERYWDKAWRALPHEVASYARNGRAKSYSARLNGDSSQPSQRLAGKRIAVLLFSNYPADPRPRRAAEALAKEGAHVDVLCLQQHDDEKASEVVNGVNVRRLPLKRRRGKQFAYLRQYSTFILLCFFHLAARSLRKRYHLVHIHNMPDVLVFAAAVPKLLGARLVLDLHDPMPELMQTIFKLPGESVSVRALRTLEKRSLAFTDLALTVNIACQDIYSSRSCDREKIQVIMNSPDDNIFTFRPAYLNGVDSAPKPFTILYHGSLVQRNGLDLAIEALDLLRKKIPHIVLRVCGEPTPFLHKVMESVRQCNLEDNFQCLGAQDLDGIVRAINSCDVGIIPNHKNLFTEINTPTRIFEYLALGKPVVAPRTKGILDYFDEQELVFFEVGSAVDLARKIEAVHADRVAAHETVVRGQQVYLKHAWSRERDRFLQAIGGLLQA